METTKSQTTFISRLASFQLDILFVELGPQMEKVNIATQFY